MFIKHFPIFYWFFSSMLQKSCNRKLFCFLVYKLCLRFGPHDIKWWALSKKKGISFLCTRCRLQNVSTNQFMVYKRSQVLANRSDAWISDTSLPNWQTCVILLKTLQQPIKVFHLTSILLFRHHILGWRQTDNSESKYVTLRYAHEHLFAVVIFFQSDE